MHEVIPDVYTFDTLRMGRVYCLRDRDGLTLIDSGLKADGGRILAELARTGASPGRVRRILVTHAHRDHVGGLQQVQAGTGAPVWISAIDRPVAEGREPGAMAPDDAPMTRLDRLMPRPANWMDPSPVARELADGEVLPEVAGGLQVVATPGHTLGHLAYWHPTRRIAFVGDTIMHLVGRLWLPVGAFTVNMAENIRSIQKLAALEPQVICFGHGVPITRHAAATLHAFAAQMQARLAD
jgi:glyoxylase-like metal-dependent hydrolase (beta-lactamase superfamily II)